MPVRTIQVSTIQEIEEACVSECGDYYLTVSNDNEGASFQYDCMMDNCNNLWHMVLRGNVDNWTVEKANHQYNKESQVITVKHARTIAELATGEYASWKCLKNFLDTVEIPYIHHSSSDGSDYLFIGYRGDDLLAHYGNDVDVYTSTLASWFATWEALATGEYDCYSFKILRIDGTSDDSCDCSGGFLASGHLPFDERVKDIINSMRDLFPSNLMFDDASVKHAIANVVY
jgi:hypothetical protein